MMFVEIRSEAFTADAVHWSEIPATQIINFIAADSPVRAFQQARRMLMLALSQEEGEAFDRLTLKEAIEVIDQYLLNTPVSKESTTMFPFEQ
jgi:hypothetical protein